MTILCDLLKVFVPFGWACTCLVAVVAYLAVPVSPRWIAASAWLVSMIISIGFVFHIWNYHRSSKPANYRALPEPNQKNVTIKVIIATVVCVATLVLSIYFWSNNEPAEYADACGLCLTLGHPPTSRLNHSILRLVDHRRHLALGPVVCCTYHNLRCISSVKSGNRKYHLGDKGLVMFGDQPAISTDGEDLELDAAGQKNNTDSK